MTSTGVKTKNISDINEFLDGNGTVTAFTSTNKTLIAFA